MEVVASGMAVASLSLQLVDSVKRIRTFLRHVKDAPKELERLIDLLARLSTQLQEVHDICDQQASGQGPGLQPRSNTISQQLQSCKNTIQPLQELVEKYSKPGSGGPGFSKLMREIKLGAKAKSILELEERLEREMGYLQNAVVYSMAAMVKNTHPIMMQIHAVVTANSQVSSTHATTASATVSVTTDADPGIPCRTRSSRRVREVQRMPSLLEPFGVQRHKIIYRYRTDPQRQSKRSLHDTNEFILEHDEVSFVWTRFGYRISWDQSRSWTNILPSLRFCPVVEQFDDDLYDLIASGDIWEIQQFFAFGKIHPSTRNSFGQSLLHVSLEPH
ncbi:hypothetical protein NX059_006221 [Plenodomus lindquistii]|nr:hypothetical protein NX059_006221 [Plenodomus lindquistii]